MVWHSLVCGVYCCHAWCLHCLEGVERGGGVSDIEHGSGLGVFLFWGVVDMRRLF